MIKRPADGTLKGCNKCYVLTNSGQCIDKQAGGFDNSDGKTYYCHACWNAMSMKEQWIEKYGIATPFPISKCCKAQVTDSRQGKDATLQCVECKKSITSDAGLILEVKA